MKYAQLLTGLLIGTALGGSVVAATDNGTGSGMSKDDVRALVHDEILNNGQLIMESVEKYQAAQHDKQSAQASESLKDAGIQKSLYDAPDTAFVGNKDGKKIAVEFFDYNCPACKMMFPAIEKNIAENKDVKIVFKELPIFGPVSDHNSAIGLAIWHLYPTRYWEFHTKMMHGPGHAGQELTYSVLKDMNLDKDKVEAEAKDPKYAKMIEDNRAVAQKLNIQGTPAVIFKDHMVPGAMDYDQLKAALAKE